MTKLFPEAFILEAQTQSELVAREMLADGSARGSRQAGGTLDQIIDVKIDSRVPAIGARRGTAYTSGLNGIGRVKVGSLSSMIRKTGIGHRAFRKGTYIPAQNVERSADDLVNVVTRSLVRLRMAKEAQAKERDSRTSRSSRVGQDRTLHF